MYTKVECSVSAFIIATFVILATLSPAMLVGVCKEDGLLENLSALFFVISAVFFYLASKNLYVISGRKWKNTTLTIAWALLMLIFFGEEISWGQRIFNYATPASLVEHNLQQEFNIHNLAAVDSAFGGKYRYFSIMLLFFSLVFPVMKYVPLGRKILKLFTFPVATPAIALLVFLAYVYGKFFFNILPNDAASEIREFLFSLGVMWFSWLCAFRPKRVYVLE